MLGCEQETLNWDGRTDVELRIPDDQNDTTTLQPTTVATERFDEAWEGIPPETACAQHLWGPRQRVGGVE